MRVRGMRSSVAATSSSRPAPAAASSAAAITSSPWPMVSEKVSTTRTGTPLKVPAAVTAEP